MQEIKNIILDRISSIKQLQSHFKSDAEGHNPQKYSLILQQKRIQKIRSHRETQLMQSLSAATASPKQLFQISLEICTCYDPTFEEGDQEGEWEEEADGEGEGQGQGEGQGEGQGFQRRINLLYLGFFQKWGFEEKGTYIRRCLEKNRGVCWGPALYLGWLAEWSKRVYCKILQTQIQKTFQNKDLTPKHEPTRTTTLNLTCGPPKKLQQTSPIPEQKLAEPSCSSYFTSQLWLTNRANILGYFLDDLNIYYKLTDLEELDVNYLKNVRKRNPKERLLKSTNLRRAVGVLMDVTGNRYIAGLLNQYRMAYEGKFGKIKDKDKDKERDSATKAETMKMNTTKIEHIKRESLRIASTKGENIMEQISKFQNSKGESINKIHSIKQENTKNNYEKVYCSRMDLKGQLYRRQFPSSPLAKKRTRFFTTQATQLEDQSTALTSKLLSPKSSQIQFQNPENISTKLRNIKMSCQYRSTKQKLQFPDISPSKRQLQLGIRLPVKENEKEKEKEKQAKMVKICNLKEDLITTLHRKIDRMFLKCEGVKKHCVQARENTDWRDKTKEKKREREKSMHGMRSENVSRKSSVLPVHLSDFQERRFKISKMFDLIDLREFSSSKTRVLLI